MSVSKSKGARIFRVAIFSFLLAALTIIAPSDSLQAQQNDSALSQALSGLNVRSFKAKTAAVISLGELGTPGPSLRWKLSARVASTVESWTMPSSSAIGMGRPTN